jgi:hypothetical protein
VSRSRPFQGCPNPTNLAFRLRDISISHLAALAPRSTARIDMLCSGHARFLWKERAMRMFLATSVALGVSATVFAAPAGPTAPPFSASIPDFSGIWGHPYWPGFEPPASGPGPVTNRSRLPSGPQAGVSNPSLLVGDYTNPILKPKAAEVLKERGENELSGAGSPTPLNQCWPDGVPFILFNPGMQMLQQPAQITILYGDYQFRQVRMNQLHPPKSHAVLARGFGWPLRRRHARHRHRGG